MAFFISWLGWIPQTLNARGQFPFDHPLFNFLGGAGPTLAAILTLLALKEKDKIGERFKALFKWKAPARQFAFVFGFWFLATALALGVGALFGRELPAFGGFAWGSLPLVFLAMLLSNVWEEIGWRGFALPRLREKMDDLPLSILMGLLWSLWHLPLLFNPSSPMSSQPWEWEVLFSVSLTILYVWLFAHTQGSLFFASVFHAMSNTVAFGLLQLGAFEWSYPYVVGAATLAALAVIWRYGARRFESAPD